MALTIATHTTLWEFDPCEGFTKKNKFDAQRHPDSERKKNHTNDCPTWEPNLQCVEHSGFVVVNHVLNHSAPGTVYY